jgi:hypothetical protein
MTPMNSVRQHTTSAATNGSRRPNTSGSTARARNLRLAYDGVLEAYVRDISTVEGRRRGARGSHD